MDVHVNVGKGRPANVEKHACAGHESGSMLNDREAREVVHQCAESGSLDEAEDAMFKVHEVSKGWSKSWFGQIWS